MNIPIFSNEGMKHVDFCKTISGHQFLHQPNTLVLLRDKTGRRVERSCRTDGDKGFLGHPMFFPIPLCKLFHDIVYDTMTFMNICNGLYHIIMILKLVSVYDISPPSFMRNYYFCWLQGRNYCFSRDYFSPPWESESESLLFQVWTHMFM